MTGLAVTLSGREGPCDEGSCAPGARCQQTAERDTWYAHQHSALTVVDQSDILKCHTATSCNSCDECVHQSLGWSLGQQLPRSLRYVVQAAELFFKSLANVHIHRTRALKPHPKISHRTNGLDFRGTYVTEYRQCSILFCVCGCCRERS